MPPTTMYSMGFLDHSNEWSHTGISLPTMTALNYAAVVGNRDAIAAAVNDVTNCNMVSSVLTVAQEQLAYAIPANAYAQREIGLRVSYQDAVTFQKGSLTIPGAKLDLLAQEGTDLVNPTAATWLALVAALEANAKSVDGNAITVLSGRIVGRSS